MAATRNSSRISSPMGPGLSDDVEPSLLRGVRISKALDNFGSIWSCSAASTTEEQRKCYAMSEPVKRIDDFISHDWATGRWSKWLALCYIYNARLAMMISLAACFAVLLLMLFGVVPAREATVYPLAIAGQELIVPKLVFFFPLGYALFWLIFVFGQQGRPPRTAFVDKVCIKQDDAELKRQGIMALAGFLRRSDRLVMLWTPRYFTRLWCMYEIAAWLRVRGERGFYSDVVFMPISRALFFILLQLGFFVYYCLWEIGNAIGIPEFVTVVAAQYLALIGFTLCSRKTVRDAMTLPQQLSDFAIRDAQCFCCSNGHVDPATGDAIPCDRRFIYDTLRRWFANSTIGSEDELLDHFDSMLRNQVRRRILASLRIVQISYVDMLITNLPGILLQFDLVPLHLGLHPDLVTRHFVFLFVLAFFFFPCWAKLIFLGICRALRVSFRYERQVGLCAATGLVALLALVGGILLYAPLAIARAAASPTLIWLALAMYGLLTLVLFGPAWAQRGSTTTEDNDIQSSNMLWSINSSRAGPIDCASQGHGDGAGRAEALQHDPGSGVSVQPNASILGNSSTDFELTGNDSWDLERLLSL